MPPSDNDPTKNRGPKPGGAGKPGPRADGPILDLTAKRVGEAAPGGAAGAKPSDPKPSDPKPSDPKPFGAGSSEPPKPVATGPSVSRPLEPGPSDPTKAGETKPVGTAPVGSNTSGTSTSVPSTSGPNAAAPNTSGATPADTAALRLGSAAAAVAAGPTVSTPAKPEPAGAPSSATPIRPSPSGAPADAKAPDAKAPGTTGSREQAVPPPGLGSGSGRAATSVPPVEKPHADKTADRPTTPPPARRGGLGALAAGLLGGVVGAGLLYGLQYLAPARTGGADPRVAALESRLDGLAPKDALAALTARVAAAEGRLGPLADAAKSAGDEARAAREAAGRAPAAAAPPNTARLDALAGRIDGLEGAVKALPSGETVRGAEQRVAALEEQGRTRAQALAALEGRAASAGEAAAANGRRLDEQAAIGSTINGRVEALARDVAGRAEASRLQAGLRVVAADRVATALALGQPYAEALGALKGLDASQATGNLAMLEAYAAGGAPTVQGLAREFRPLAERIEAGSREAAQRGVAATGSLTDRLASMAGSIVSVRRVGDAPVAAGPNPLSRVQAALDRGDLADAAKAWDALPDGARAASAEFGASLKRRAAADEAARAISTAALAALGAPAR